MSGVKQRKKAPKESLVNNSNIKRVGVAHSHLTSILSYSRDTGEFHWKKDRDNGRIKAGSLAGSVAGTGYLTIKVDGQAYSAHKLAIYYDTKAYPFAVIDHLNQDKLDNRISNLALSTTSDNAKNRKLTERNKYGVFGLYYIPNKKLFRVSIGHLGKRMNVGLYKTLEEAISARLFAESYYDYSTLHGVNNE